MTEYLIGTNYKFVNTKTGQTTTAFFDRDSNYLLKRASHFMRGAKIYEVCEDMDTFSGVETGRLTRLRDRMYTEVVEAIHPLTKLSVLVKILSEWYD